MTMKHHDERAAQMAGALHQHLTDGARMTATQARAIRATLAAIEAIERAERAQAAMEYACGRAGWGFDQ